MRHFGRRSDLRGDLRLETEAVRAELDALQHLAAEDLVAGLHIREVKIREHVRQHRQELVGDVVEVEDAMALADEARAKDDVGAVLDDRTSLRWPDRTRDRRPERR